MKFSSGNVAGANATSRAGVFVLGAAFVACVGLVGALLGGTYVRFLMPRAPDGWTGIAQGLGGLMMGGLIALVVAIFLVGPLARRGARVLALATIAAASAAAVLALGLYLARPGRPSQSSISGAASAPVVRVEGVRSPLGEE